MNLKNQPWLDSARVDSWLILFPAVFPVILIWLFPDYFQLQTSVTSLWWVILVLNIDVAHVYSTLFRFYWDRSTLTKYKLHLILIPLISLAIGVLLYWIDGMLFWRVLAYVAVFHFVRQQYGFMRLYARKESYNQTHRIIDGMVIYAATLYPLLYWHMFYIDQFNWFIKGDFVKIPNVLAPVFTGLYLLIIVVYLIKEIRVSITNGSINIPKNALLAGTIISWYVGIVLFRGDLIFTMLNVIAHGIPYMALVYIYGKKKATASFKVPWANISIFLVTVLMLAYFEEGLWDMFVWNDHQEVFPFTSGSTQVSPTWLAFVVPLLALPQITHYVLDGFIWKVSREKNILDQKALSIKSINQ